MFLSLTDSVFKCFWGERKSVWVFLCALKQAIKRTYGQPSHIPVLLKKVPIGIKLNNMFCINKTHRWQGDWWGTLSNKYFLVNVLIMYSALQCGSWKRCQSQVVCFIQDIYFVYLDHFNLRTNKTSIS